MFNATELLGQILQSGISNSARRRLQHALRPDGAGQPDGPLGELLGQPAGDDGGGSGAPLRGLAESAGEFVGADRSTRGDNPLAVGGLGASGRATSGVGRGAMPGALGSGALALLSGLALSALGKPEPSAEKPAAAVAPGRPPQDAGAAEQPEKSATLILAAMINAAKADGQVDQEELQRIVGKLREAGATAEALDFVLSELRKPMDLEGLIQSVPSPQLALQLYAASLLAIEMDTEGERRYLRRLAHGLGLEASAVRRVHQCLGVGHA